MKKKLLIIGASFISLICVQVFSSGHKHVVVVEENVSLTNENKALSQENSGLKSSVNALQKENTKLTDEKTEMQQMVSEVIGDLDSTKSIVKKIKKELTNEQATNARISNGDEFDFQPIKLPTEDGN
jgi:FtsZ-binding cell division protein ZapB